MQKYFVEGVFHASATRRNAMRSLEALPFSRVYWANSAQEALQLALADLPGAQWVDGPRVVRQSEEERMRQAGAPELFNLTDTKKPKQRRKTR